MRMAVYAAALLCLTGSASGDLCDRMIFNSGSFDGLNAISNERSTQDEEPDGQGAVHAEFSEPATIEGITWFAAEREFQWNGDMDVIILLPDGKKGAPGTVVHEFSTNQGQRVDTGGQVLGLEVYAYTAALPSLRLEAGAYWLGGRPVTNERTGRSFWATSPLEHDPQAHWRSPFFRQPDWIPLEKMIRNKENLALCLSGFLGEDECAGQLVGDSSCDGVVDFADIDCFVAALVGQETWNECGGASGCDFICVNDVDRSGDVAFDDIDPFVECLVNGCE